MKKQLIATSIILSLAMSPVMASSTTQKTDNTNEIIGLSTGAVIGGLIAGPIGLVVAGTVGLFIGHSQEQKDQIERVETHLVKNKMAMKSLSNEKQGLENRLAQSEQTQHFLTEKLALTEKTLNHADKLEQLKLNLRFDIDSTQVESFYIPQIKHLAMMMQENPELSVNLSGYSDPSGSEDSNLKLSQARIESVKLMLVNLGVDETYINTEAFGESHSMQANRTTSSNFNERRVDVQLFAEEQVIVSEQGIAIEQDVAKKQEIAQTQMLTEVN
jgi:sortase system peptidoglycan-associated protein